MRVTIEKTSQPGYWYKRIIGLQVDVKYNPSRHDGSDGTYTIITTSHNRSVLPDFYHQHLGTLLLVESDVSEAEVDNEGMIQNLRKVDEVEPNPF